MKKSDFSAEDVVGWRQDPVTQEFFERIKLYDEDKTKQIKNTLTTDTLPAQERLLKATRLAAETDFLGEILDIPSRMIEDIKKEEG